MKGDHSAHAVHAVVCKGLVTAFEVDACCSGEKGDSRSPEIPAALRRAVDRAVRELAPPPKVAARLPIPLAELAIGDISIDTWGRTCSRVCIQIFGIRYCLTCCTAWGPANLPPTTMCWPIETTL